MNGKKAKALRRIAQQQTVGFEEREYVPTVPRLVKDIDALRGKTSPPQRIVDAKCTRGVTNYLKNQMKRGELTLRKGAV